MPLGAQARRWLGPLFPAAARFYRSLFVDLDRVAASFPRLAPGDVVLDVGGGDGALVDLLLARNPGARITMIDTRPEIGRLVSAERAARVERLPATSLRDYRASGRPPPELVLVSDVVHHVPAALRRAFFEDVRDLLGNRSARLVVKEVAPGSPRARLAWLADRWITGDRHVAFLRPEELRALVTGVFPGAACEVTPLETQDAPNYCLVFSLPGRVA